MNGDGDFRAGQHEVYVKHADDRSGMVSYWFLGKPSVSFLLAEDARTVLMASSYRRTVPFLRNHSEHFLGRRSIVNLMGKEWKYYRAGIHRAFTAAALDDAQVAVEAVCRTLRRSLRRRILDSGDGGGGGNGGGNGGFIRTEILPLMKMATIDAFALGVDLQCCSRLHLTPVARAFDYLTEEYTRRLMTPFDPSASLYWIPTRANRKHSEQRRLIRSFLDGVVEARRRERTMMDDTDGTTVDVDADAPPEKKKDLLTYILEANDKDMASSKKRRMSSDSSSSGRSSTSSKMLSMLDSLSGGKKRRCRSESFSSSSGRRESASHRAGIGGTYAYDDKLFKETLTDTLMTILFGGYDTTSIALSYALYLLALHPEAKMHCLTEVRRAMALTAVDNENDPSSSSGVLDTTNSLHYTRAVILETLRLYPPAPVAPRDLERPLEMHGHVLPAGTCTSVPIWSVQRDERNFPRPEEFLPERWATRRRRRRRGGEEAGDDVWEERTVQEESSSSSPCEGEDDDDDSDEEKKEECCCSSSAPTAAASSSVPAGNRAALFAFSGGARNCVGYKLAMRKAVTMLAYLVDGFEFDLVRPNYRVTPVQTSIVQRPRDNLPMVISCRE